MTRKLRWEFSVIMMAIIVSPLAVIFITLCCTTKVNYVQQGTGTLHSAMLGNYPGGMREQARQPPFTDQHPPSRPYRQEPPLMVADIRQGNYTAVENQLPDIESWEAETLIFPAESKDGESGTLKDLHLRFPRGKTKSGQTVRYAFADIYEEQNSFYWQVIHSSIIGASLFAAFFLFSIPLSGQAVKPVEIAWQRWRQFAADASHELKAPLTIILSNADMPEKDRDIPKGQNRQRIGHIKAKSLRMKQLIENLLAMAQSDSGQEFAICVPIDLSFTVNNSLMAFEPLAFGIDKHITYGIETSLHVSGDDKKFRQLIDIFLDNTCRCSQDNGSICVTLKETSAKEALLTVSDEGAPLTREEIKYLSLRFYRGDTTYSNIPGYGLEFSIAQNIVSEHRGEIEASTDGFATNPFMVRLPIQE